MVVALRMCVGWHFMYEGRHKHNEVNFSSEGYLRQAKGPLAEFFKDQLPTFHGFEKLRIAPQAKEAWGATVTKAVDEWRGVVVAAWKARLSEVADHYGFDEAQSAAAERRLTHATQQLTDYLKEIQVEASPSGIEPADLETYFQLWNSLAEDRGDTTTRDSGYQQKRLYDAAQRTSGMAAGWLATLKGYEKDLFANWESLATAEQRSSAGDFVPPKTMLEKWDRFMPWFLMICGACILTGFCARLACFLGGLFLISVIVVQPALPGVYPPAHPALGNALIINKEFIEMMALFALAALPTGRWFGLDYLVGGLLCRCCSKGKCPSKGECHGPAKS